MRKFLYGVGKTRRLALNRALLQRKDKRNSFKGLSFKVITKIKDIALNSFTLERPLRVFVFSRICYLKKIFNYRGLRHEQGLPISGRTHTNGKTPRYMKKMNLHLPFSFGFSAPVEAKSTLSKKKVTKLVKKTVKKSSKKKKNK